MNDMRQCAQCAEHKPFAAERTLEPHEIAQYQAVRA